MNKIIFKNNDIKLLELVWKTYIKQQYEVMIEKGYVDKIYNIPNKKGILYNQFEDTYAIVSDDSYIITGLMGEMWVVHEETLDRYNIKKNDIKDKPIKCTTKTPGSVYLATRISKDIKYCILLDDGYILHGNVDSIDHGEGDYIVCLQEAPDECWTVNGKIFLQAYKEME